MATLEDIAGAVLNRDDLAARSLVQDLERAGVDIAACPEPQTSNMRVRTMAAALVSLFAWRRGVPAPVWTKTAGCFPEPFYTSRYALTSATTRAGLERETPNVLRRFAVYASPDFLRQV
jgi:hypothetical protein